ncbi:hypothetical protein [Saccharothrix stipae]
MADRPYESTVEPEVGGEVRVTVDGWGRWAVWVDVVPYEAVGTQASAPLTVRETLGVARRLVTAAAVCWWRARKDNHRG